MLKNRKRTLAAVFFATVACGVLMSVATPATALPTDDTMNYTRRAVQTVESHDGGQRGTFVTAMTVINDSYAPKIRVYAGVQDLEYYTWPKWWANSYDTTVVVDIILRRNGKMESEKHIDLRDTSGELPAMGESVDFDTDGLPGTWRADVSISVKGMRYGGTTETIASDLYPAPWSHKVEIPEVPHG